MSYEEMLRIVSILNRLGIDKVRITGGEPFLRKDLMKFISSLAVSGLRQIAVTTNGVLTAPFVPQLRECGITSVNLSLDTLNEKTFRTISHRDDLHSVLKTYELLLKYGFDVKINAVVMADKNIEDIVSLTGLTKEENVSVRFIEEMPFNGQGKEYSGIVWNYRRILEHIRNHFPSVEKIDDPPYSTSMNYRIEGHKGTIGIIAAYSRSFCGTCNRLRITPSGMLKTCLYDHGVLNIKQLLRSGANDEAIGAALLRAVNSRAKNGFEAEKNSAAENTVHESMAEIGG
jgi:cyclic pyranopterin phosphate synthase